VTNVRYKPSNALDINCEKKTIYDPSFACFYIYKHANGHVVHITVAYLVGLCTNSFLASRKPYLVHPKAVRSHWWQTFCVLWVLYVLYVFESINWRWCRHNTIPLSHNYQVYRAVSDGVSQSPKGGGGAGFFPPLNPPLLRLLLTSSQSYQPAATHQVKVNIKPLNMRGGGVMESDNEPENYSTRPKSLSDPLIKVGLHQTC